LQRNRNSSLTKCLQVSADAPSQPADRLSTSSDCTFVRLSRHLPKLLPTFHRLAGDVAQLLRGHLEWDVVVPAKAETHTLGQGWIPACAGMTDKRLLSTHRTRSIRSLRSHRTLLHSRRPRRCEHGRSSPVGIPRRSQDTRQSTLCTDRMSDRSSRS